MRTLRAEIIRLLMEHREGLNVREICQLLDLEPEREREVYSHLKAIARILRRKGFRLLMLPPRCKECGFEFNKLRVSKCPKCKSERIEAARFKID